MSEEQSKYDEVPFLAKDDEEPFPDRRSDSICQEIKLPPRSRSRLSRLWRTFCFIVIGATVASSFWAALLAVQLVVKKHEAPTDEQLQAHYLSPCHPGTELNCGSSATQARELGCHFQLWSYSWVPHLCFNEELHDNFLARRAEEGWGYYRDLDGREEMTLNEVLKGETSNIYTTWGQHFWHCAYYSRNFFLAKVGITNRDRDLHHGMHCQKWMSNPFYHPWEAIVVNLTVGYHSCDATHGLRVLDTTDDFYFPPQK